MKITSNKGVEWWGSLSFQNKLATIISGVDCEKEIWKRDETIKSVVTLNNAAENIDVKLTLKDSFGRIFAEEIKKVNNDKIEFSLPLKSSKGLTFTAIAQIIQNNVVVDEFKKELIIYGKPNRNKYQVLFGWPSVAIKGFRKFLAKPYYARLKALGATCIQQWNHTTKYTILKARELDMPLVADRCPAFAGGKHPDKKIEGKGKFGLLRHPCLSTPRSNG